MKSGSWRLAISGIALLGGCAAPQQRNFPPPEDYVPMAQVQIASRFTVIPVTRDNVDQEARKCIPKLPLGGAATARLADRVSSTDTTALRHTSSANYFVVMQSSAVCIQQSSEKFPIFAAEAFFATVNPTGVPPDITDGWYRQLAMLLAKQGVAKVAYVYSNGNATLASYWFSGNSSVSLLYSSEFRKKGAWETERFDTQFSHPTIAGVEETVRNNLKSKSTPVLHRTR